MGRKKMRGKRVGGISQFVATNAALGVGADVVQRTGGNAAAVGNVSAFMPAVGSAIGAKMTLGSLEGIKKKRGGYS